MADSKEKKKREYRDMKTLTNSEALIMKCLWDCGGEMPMIRLMDKLNEVYDKNWKRTTIRTFLFHLEEKEYLKVHRIGRSSFIKQQVSLEQYRQVQARKVLDFWYDGSVSVFLEALEKSRSEDFI